MGVALALYCWMTCCARERRRICCTVSLGQDLTHVTTLRMLESDVKVCVLRFNWSQWIYVYACVPSPNTLFRYLFTQLSAQRMLLDCWLVMGQSIFKMVIPGMRSSLMMS